MAKALSRSPAEAQYCSLKDPNLILDFLNVAFAPLLLGPFADLSFDLTGIDPAWLRSDAFFEDLIQHGFMKGWPRLRGECCRRSAVFFAPL